MRYYTSDLWLKLNSPEKDEREQAEQQWYINSAKYDNVFKQITPRLPVAFLEYYKKAYGFHDCKILSIFVNEGRNAQVIIDIEVNTEIFHLQLNQVDKSIISIVDKSSCIANELQWGYAEFEIVDKRRLKLNILCDIYNEMEFVFQTLHLTKQG